MPITWQLLHHSELSKNDLYAALRLRTQVFVVEQQCPYQEVDGLDLQADTCHLLAWDGDTLVAYLRLLDPSTQEGEVTIGRVVIAEQARGTGLGHTLMEQALAACAERWPEIPVYLSAQAHLQRFYGRSGFVAVTEEYLEDGIPHIGMRRIVD
ncbi:MULTISPECIES: GNAT family N-acetyltransferase [unclassified Pseudomonas]|uniref:GNAT family N-acetyltransferase n=1 Tax=unclassified Pseudomonas TaxID=196821 RepID=UPI002449B50B|nr:GNAT family N-acetyltransferase [Pseudomonas sp. GD03944]MDH1264745.1 GNAT family N-acetyltransferase [Pseudomonas sp. GD03944]